MRRSSIPDAVDALVAMAQTVAAAMPTGQRPLVTDGPPRSLSGQFYAAIGIAGPNGEAAIPQAETTSGLSRVRDRESYDIACQVSAYAGAGPIKTQRDIAFSFLDAFAEALAADGRLGGLVMLARLSGMDYAASEGTPGPTATVNFTVHIEAQRR